jgi:hypothetical protein
MTGARIGTALLGAVLLIDGSARAQSAPSREEAAFRGSLP